jgi:hypothetical protein
LSDDEDFKDAHKYLKYKGNKELKVNVHMKERKSFIESNKPEIASPKKEIIAEKEEKKTLAEDDMRRKIREMVRESIMG